MSIVIRTVEPIAKITEGLEFLPIKKVRRGGSDYIPAFLNVLLSDNICANLQGGWSEGQEFPNLTILLKGTGRPHSFGWATNLPYYLNPDNPEPNAKTLNLCLPASWLPTPAKKGPVKQLLNDLIEASLTRLLLYPVQSASYRHSTRQQRQELSYTVGSLGDHAIGTAGILKLNGLSLPKVQLVPIGAIDIQTGGEETE